ncbi:MAG: diguanylate cyclase [Synergistetes bacterium]|nr:diguanylate cyclase [Synergistota bacterium]MCX8127464.1 diguanylate cyclase [Synergistota bacterium]MDW8192759.1 GGDEF domain-containing protein [Synergistota bacterium]
MVSLLDSNELEKRKKELERISEIARTALIFATDKRYYIPLTPENYERCYKIVEKFKESNIPLTWENFIKEWGLNLGTSDKETVLAETSAKLYAVAEELANHAENLHGMGKDFDSTIEIFSDGVKEAVEKRDISSLVKGLLEEVVRARKKIDDLNKELEDSKRQIKDLKQELKKVQTEALTDRLTGALNRGSLETMVVLNIKKKKVEGTPFSVVIFDIDNFKEINDKYGHVFGDDVLRKVTEVVKSGLSNGDLLYRYGGDEFCILMPGRKLEDAFAVMERILSNVEKVLFPTSKGNQIRVTLSAGLAEASKKDTPRELLLRADEALYLAKSKGKGNIKTERDLKTSMIAKVVE